MTTQQNQVVPTHKAVRELLEAPSMKKRIEEVLGKKAAGFISSVVSAVNSNPSLGQCEPGTVVMSAMVAATLDLPINANLGFAHIVPYGNRAQFQMGWRGFVQLAIRTSKYRTINVTEVYANQIEGRNNLTGEIKLNDQEPAGEICGYLAYYSTKDGFEKMVYMNVAQIQAHGQKHSKSYAHKNGQWATNFDAMARKTVLKMLLSRWGMLSIEVQRAVEADQAIVTQVTSEGTVMEYADNPEQKTEDGTATVIQEEGENANNAQQVVTAPLDEINNLKNLDL